MCSGQLVWSLTICDVCPEEDLMSEEEEVPGVSFSLVPDEAGDHRVVCHHYHVTSYLKLDVKESQQYCFESR